MLPLGRGGCQTGGVARTFDAPHLHRNWGGCLKVDSGQAFIGHPAAAIASSPPIERPMANLHSIRLRTLPLRSAGGVWPVRAGTGGA